MPAPKLATMADRFDIPRRYPEQAEHCVPDQYRAIARLRRMDASFAEACDDYELLVRDLHRLHQPPDRLDSHMRVEQALLVDSLKGLTEEISSALRRFAPCGGTSTGSATDTPSSGGSD